MFRRFQLVAEVAFWAGFGKALPICMPFLTPVAAAVGEGSPGAWAPPSSPLGREREPTQTLQRLWVDRTTRKAQENAAKFPTTVTPSEGSHGQPASHRPGRQPPPEPGSATGGLATSATLFSLPTPQSIPLSVTVV